MSTPIRKSLFATVAALALAGGLAGCQSSPASDSAPSGLDIDPLAVVSDYIGSDNEATKQEQRVIAQCMQDQGFSYTPIEDTGDGTSTASSWLSPSREAVTEHGYGIVEGYLDFAANTPAQDTNTAYRDGLSAAEQSAYDTALLGDFAQEGSHDGQTWDDQGCTGKAEHAIAEAKLNPPQIIQQASEFRNTLGNDPKVTAIFEEWGACMSEAGFPDEPRYGFGGTLDTKVNTFFGEHPDAAASEPAVEKLKSEEVTVALADLDCAEKVKFDRRYVDTMTELEKQFVDDHKAELDEARIWAQQNLGAQ